MPMKLFAELNREQIRALAPESLVVLPIGATEQHGPHLATGMDYFTVEWLARQAATVASAQIPIIVAPALPFGSSHHHFVFGGTMSLRPKHTTACSTNWWSPSSATASRASSC